MTNQTPKECKHCGMNVDIRNPSGYCDHLYYPENCKVSADPKKDWEKEFDKWFNHGTKDKPRFVIAPDGYKEVKQYIRELLAKERNRVIEIIGEDEEDDSDPEAFPEGGSDHAYIRNKLRADLRKRVEK